MLWPFPRDVEAEEGPCLAGPGTGIWALLCSARAVGSWINWARSLHHHGQNKWSLQNPSRSLGFLPISLIIFNFICPSAASSRPLTSQPSLLV